MVTSLLAVSFTYNCLIFTGWNRYSVGYFSDTGRKYSNSIFNSKPCGLPFQEGDVIGVGYRHRTGTIFFTRNGRKLEDAYSNLNWNLFPTIGANGPCQIHVNLGQMGKLLRLMDKITLVSTISSLSTLGFLFVEANVKKWGLAPIQGTMAPPPAYGIEGGSILLASSSRIRDDQDSSRASARLPDDTQFTASGSTSRVMHPPPYSSSTIEVDGDTSD
jgi:hypothetical protein